LKRGEIGEKAGLAGIYYEHNDLQTREELMIVEEEVD